MSIKDFALYYWGTIVLVAIVLSSSTEHSKYITRLVNSILTALIRPVLFLYWSMRVVAKLVSHYAMLMNRKVRKWAAKHFWL